jgi:hypothetical protein
MSMRRMVVRTLLASTTASKMRRVFVTLAQLSVCQKQQEVVPYDDYDVDEENGGQDPGGEYDGE